MQHPRRHTSRSRSRNIGSAPLRRPGAATGAGATGALTARTTKSAPVSPRIAATSLTYPAHPLVQMGDNARLHAHEDGVKSAFDSIVPVLKRISALQHEADFVARAQAMAQNELGLDLPQELLANAWVDRLDMRRLFAWCVFATYQRFSDDFFTNDPLASPDREEFDAFLQACGFHMLDVTPCADGRLAHLVRYVLRLPYRAVRRKSHAGSLFDIEDNVQKWVEVELNRFREGKPNFASDPTRYLKVVTYHYSSVDPEHEGCAAHGSNTAQAAQAGLERLIAFRQAIENSHCCGASIDLLLIGLDTDTDAIRVHVPDGAGDLDLQRHVDAMPLFHETLRMGENDARQAISAAIRAASPDVADTTSRFVGQLLENNFSQIAYVREFHGAQYADIGHAERFIGAGIGFEEIQLRNLMYFAYLDTLEEGVADMDVGIKIFSGLNVGNGLPVPIVVRFDYHGHVPGARDRAVARCGRVSAALQDRYADLSDRGLLHVMQAVRDCSANATIEILACSARPVSTMGAH